LKYRRQRSASDKLIDVKIVHWERDEWGVCKRYRDDQGDWFVTTPANNNIADETEAAALYDMSGQPAAN
jgi:hypothetical protein